MKLKNHKKGLTIAVLVALLLTFTVSGTIAFLTDKTDEVKNVFTPTEVDTEIVEKFTDNTEKVKTSIAVKNVQDDNHVDAYVRVAVVGNWCDAKGNIVKPWEANFNCNTTDWAKGNDGYYYYKKVLPVGQTTENLLASGVNIAKTSNEPGYENLHLEVTVIQQAIQAEPSYVVAEVWPVTVNDDGTLSTK